jgi:hypothetical protein
MYLWQQNLICRFNEEGKKSKSKGNHIWVSMLSVVLGG